MRRKPIIHEVKSWVHLFQAFKRGEKTHDIRILDRDYQVGDVLRLGEYDKQNEEYTGRFSYAEITYITSNNHVACAFSTKALDHAYGVLSIRPIDEIGSEAEYDHSS